MKKDNTSQIVALVSLALTLGAMAYSFWWLYLGQYEMYKIPTVGK